MRLIAAGSCKDISRVHQDAEQNSLESKAFGSDTGITRQVSFV
ncbi:hypothetical protein [Paenibacillus dokdonensis]